MPAMFVRCDSCGYKFHFDYDFRPSRCNKCKRPLNWQENIIEHSARGSIGPGGRGEAPILPGEPGYEDYSQKARREHAESVRDDSGEDLDV